MRHLAIMAVSASTLVLSGCSLFDGFGGSSYKKAPTHSGVNYGGGTYSVGTTCCAGGGALSTWNLEADFGPEKIVGGDFFEGSALAAPATIAGGTYNDIDMQDAFGEAYRASIGGSYALTPNRKLTATVNYAQADGNRRTIGDNTFAAGGGTVQVTPSDYESWGVEAGLRQYFQPKIVGESFGYRPYIEGRLGAAKVGDIDLTVTNQGAVTNVVPFYEDGWVPTGAALIGVETPIFNRATIGVETGLRYAGELDRVQTGPFAGAAIDGDRWTIPVTLRGRYRF